MIISKSGDNLNKFIKYKTIQCKNSEKLLNVKQYFANRVFFCD
jgi:hypothetical protein